MDIVDICRGTYIFNKDKKRVIRGQGDRGQRRKRRARHLISRRGNGVRKQISNRTDIHVHVAATAKI